MVRTQNGLRHAGLTDLHVMKFMGEEKLWAVLKYQPNFGRKSFAELMALLNQVPAPWFEFCL